MVKEGTGQAKDRFEISELFADERCSKAILDFLATTEVGRTAGSPVADKEPGSEASEWEKRERVAEEERALGEGAEGLSIIFSFSFSFLFHVKHRKAEEGGR